MPDISMCANNLCPHRMKCYRYRAIPTPGRQSYGYFHPTKEGCEHFIEIYLNQNRLTPEGELA